MGDTLIRVERIVGWLLFEVLGEPRAHLRDTCAATNEKDFVNFVDGHARICKSIFDRWDELIEDLLSKLLELLTSDCHLQVLIVVERVHLDLCLVLH